MADQTVQSPGVIDYDEGETRDAWPDQGEELPPRPRRRLLAPVPLALLAALLIACGFIGGVEVQKGQTSSSSTATTGAGGFASRLAALGGGRAGAGTAAGAGATGGSGSTGGGGAFAGGGSGGGVTTGQVAYVSGNTLYVTTGEGNTVKVSAAAGAKVTKTVSTEAKSIHPGETVVVLGSKASNGSVSATSITVGAARAPGAGQATSGTGTSNGTPALFGSG